MLARAASRQKEIALRLRARRRTLARDAAVG
jgi:hypothetical protein